MIANLRRALVGSAAKPAPTDNVPAALVDFVAAHEGFSSTVYRCPKGVPTIGYGRTYYPDGRAVRLGDPPVSRAQALDWLRADLAKFAKFVDAMVAVPLTVGQRSALISFAFNFGEGKLGSSTLLRRLNAGDYRGAAAEFPKWCHSGPDVLPGLVKRRAEERAMFVGDASV